MEPMSGARPNLSILLADAAKGVRIIGPAQFSGPGYKDFAKRFREQYGEDPDVYAAYSYDMIRIVAAAIKRARSNGTTIRAEMSKTNFDGVTGVTRFDEHGDVVGKGFERRTLQ